jgi:hypothetical protein
MTLTDCVEWDLATAEIHLYDSEADLNMMRGIRKGKRMQMSMSRGTDKVPPERPEASVLSPLFRLGTASNFVS